MPVPFLHDDPDARDRHHVGGLLASGFVRGIDVVRGRNVQWRVGAGIDAANLVAQARPTDPRLRDLEAAPAPVSGPAPGPR